MKDSTRRAIRTALQLVYSLGTSGAISGVLVAFGAHVSTDQYAALTAVLLPVVTAFVNALEDRGAIPAVPAK